MVGLLSFHTRFYTLLILIFSDDVPWVVSAHWFAAWDIFFFLLFYQANTFSSFISWNPTEKPMFYLLLSHYFCQNEEAMLINLPSFLILENSWRLLKRQMPYCSLFGFIFQLESKSSGFRSQCVLELKANQRIVPCTHRYCSLSGHIFIQRNWIFQQYFLHFILLSVSHFMDFRSELIK